MVAHVFASASFGAAGLPVSTAGLPQGGNIVQKPSSGARARRWADTPAMLPVVLAPTKQFVRSSMRLYPREWIAPTQSWARAGAGAVLSERIESLSAV